MIYIGHYYNLCSDEINLRIMCNLNLSDNRRNGVSVTLYCLLWTNGTFFLKIIIQDFPGGTVIKNPPANAGDTYSSPGPGISHMLQST